MTWLPAVQAPDSGFAVTYTLNKFQPMTIPVQVIRTPGDSTAALNSPRPFSISNPPELIVDDGWSMS